jgi:octaprenyl-diphosphate synthase
VSTAVREMSEGELLQMEKARGLNFDEGVYFEIIRKKTASLIAACCASGAHAGGAEAEDRCADAASSASWRALPSR